MVYLSGIKHIIFSYSYKSNEIKCLHRHLHRTCFGRTPKLDTIRVNYVKIYHFCYILGFDVDMFTFHP